MSNAMHSETDKDMVEHTKSLFMCIILNQTPDSLVSELLNGEKEIARLTKIAS